MLPLGVTCFIQENNQSRLFPFLYSADGVSSSLFILFQNKMGEVNMKYHTQEPLFSQVYRTEVELTSPVTIHKIFWV